MKKPETKTNSKTREYDVVSSVKILRVKMWDNGGVTFDAQINDVSIYGLRVIEGTNGDFISFPQRKGSDGKYYSIAYMYLSPETQDMILREVEAKLNHG